MFLDFVEASPRHIQKQVYSLDPFHFSQAWRWLDEYFSKHFGTI